QRHDAVALRLVDDAVIAEHGFVHELEDGLQPLHAEFGITEGVHQSGRVADVRKQYRQTLALSALGGERLEDILPGRLSLPCDGLTQHAAAMPAKPTRWSVEVAAGLACEPESRATRFTVLVSRFVLTTAMQTLHRWSLMPDGCSPMPNARHCTLNDAKLPPLCTAHSSHGMPDGRLVACAVAPHCEAFHTQRQKYD